jgi:hypothetical protein
VNNKILNYYNRNYNFKRIIDSIKDNKKITENASSSPSNEDINKKIINYLTDYFSNNDFFIENLNSIFKNDFKDENVDLFFKQYQEFYNILKNKKIEFMLNKITNKIIKYNNDASNHATFKKDIQPKLIYYKKIMDSAEPGKENFKEKKGKYTQILAYTDIMFLYFIDLLIIIDYLTFYYY